MGKRRGLIRTTLLGGILYLVPLVVLAAVLGKAMQIAHSVGQPLVRGIEAAGLGHMVTPQVIAILLLLLFCLAAGLFAQTRIAQRIAGFIETKLLANLPGYSFYKSVGASITGIEDAKAAKVAMVQFDDAWQIALVMDELEDGRLALFIPDAPEPRTGAVCFMSPERVRPLAIPMKSAMLLMRRMGQGSREVLKGVPAPATRE
jgi:uncharacterized membrane protein